MSEKQKPYNFVQRSILEPCYGTDIKTGIVIQKNNIIRLTKWKVRRKKS